MPLCRYAVMPLCRYAVIPRENYFKNTTFFSIEGNIRGGCSYINQVQLTIKKPICLNSTV